jgi:Lon protease-like protein
MADEIHTGSSRRLTSVALFPLPNVVLFPRAVLPLHIFEERYKEMTADALAGDRQVAMALLRPGWEKNYYQAPAIEPVVCVGTILSHEKLSDGKYNFLLQGHTRARIVRERRQGSYRVADLVPIEETPVMEIDLTNERQRMVQLFSEEAFPGHIGEQFHLLLASTLNTAHIADLIAFTFVDDAQAKQELLSDGDVRRRVTRTLAALEAAAPLLKVASVRSASEPGMN